MKPQIAHEIFNLRWRLAALQTALANMEATVDKLVAAVAAAASDDKN